MRHLMHTHNSEHAVFLLFSFEMPQHWHNNTNKTKPKYIHKSNTIESTHSICTAYKRKDETNENSTPDSNCEVEKNGNNNFRQTQ